MFVPYGTGDAHRGTRAASATTWGLHFTGHTNLMAIIQSLEESHGLLSHGKHVLVTGGSAGAVGTFVNVDFVKSAMVSPDAVVKANPNAGVFFPFALLSNYSRQALRDQQHERAPRRAVGCRASARV